MENELLDRWAKALAEAQKRPDLYRAVDLETIKTSLALIERSRELLNRVRER